MRLYENIRTNNASEPWNLETRHGVYVDLDWRQFLFGVALYGYSVGEHVLTVNVGPLSIQFYINRS